MDHQQPAATANGKCRARPLDLHDIATAIRNLPADSSALLPTPALSAQFSSQLSSFSTSSASSTSDNTPREDPGLLSPSDPSDDAYQQAIDLAIRRIAHQVKRKLACGQTTLETFEASVEQRKTAYYGLATCSYSTPSQSESESDSQKQKTTAERLYDALNTLREVWMARAARSQQDIASTAAAATAGNVSVDEASVQVLTQSLVPRPASDGSLSRPQCVPCPPGTVLSWTKYYKSKSAPSSSSPATSSSFQILKKPTVQPVVGRKRRLPDTDVSPVEKKRIISLTESPDPKENTFQCQNLVCSSSDSSDGEEEQGRGQASICFDLVSSISSCPDLVHVLCDSLALKDILALYRVSRVFKATFDSNLKSNVLHLARRFASAETISIFPWALYLKATGDPRTLHGPSSAAAPSLRYVNMLVSRQRKVRDIIAMLARAGHRLPRAHAPAALKKMWLLMDIPTNRARAAFMQNRQLFTDRDLLIMQLFRVKLEMHLTNPLRGPSRVGDQADQAGQAGQADPTDTASQTQTQCSLVEVLLGQRSGLHVLWSMLRGKAYRTAQDVIELKVRYAYMPSTLTFDNDSSENDNGCWSLGPESFLSAARDDSLLFDTSSSNFAASLASVSSWLPAEAMSKLDLNPELDATLKRLAYLHNEKMRRRTLEEAIHAVPVWEMGIGHLEGWGLGTQHLLRPDELVPLEASRRRRASPAASLDLERHVSFMPVWGARDLESGRNLVPGIDELYLSDSDGEGDDDDDSSLYADDIDIDNDSDDDDDNDKENTLREADAARPSAVQAQSAAAAAVAAVVAADDDDVFATAETRLSRYCGSVPLKHSDWQPWQVLKLQGRWDRLPPRDRLDVWWMNLQERLRRQGWSYRTTVDDVQGNPVSYEEGDVDMDSDFEVDEPTGPSSDSSDSSAGLDSDSLAPNLSARHQRIVQSSIAWALREQDEVDDALLAQADLPYDEHELAHWEQFLGDVEAVLSDGGDDGGVDGDADGNGNDDMAWEDDVHNDTNGNNDNNTPPSIQPPSPEAVLVPEYGCSKEVLRLARLTYNAEMALREAEAGSTAAAPAQLAASASHLRRKLDAVIQGEVYAIEL